MDASYKAIYYFPVLVACRRQKLHNMMQLFDVGGASTFRAWKLAADGRQKTMSQRPLGWMLQAAVHSQVDPARR